MLIALWLSLYKILLSES